MNFRQGVWGAVALALAGLQAVAAHDISAFAPEGGLALGANYWGSKSATRMWQDWDPESLAKDLDVLKAHGFTYLRVFPRWDVFQPIWEAHTPYQQTYETYLTQDELPRPETPAGYAGVDERMMERFETFCDLCEVRGLKLIVCPLTGQMTFRIFTPQAPRAPRPLRRPRGAQVGAPLPRLLHPPDASSQGDRRVGVGQRDELPRADQVA